MIVCTLLYPLDVLVLCFCISISYWFLLIGFLRGSIAQPCLFHEFDFVGSLMLLVCFIYVAYVSVAFLVIHHGAPIFIVALFLAFVCFICMLVMFCCFSRA